MNFQFQQTITNQVFGDTAFETIANFDIAFESLLLILLDPKMQTVTSVSACTFSPLSTA